MRVITTLSTLAIAGLMMATSSFGAWALSCDQEAGLRSLNGDTAVDVIFVASDQAETSQFKIYWIDYEGDRVLYNQLRPGQNYTQGTYLTHPWVITKRQSDGSEACVNIHMPEKGAMFLLQ